LYKLEYLNDNNEAVYKYFFLLKKKMLLRQTLCILALCICIKKS